MDKDQYKKQQRYVEGGPEEDDQNKRTSIAEDDTGLLDEQRMQPGRSAVTRARKPEPSPTGNIGESDYPPTGE